MPRPRIEVFEIHPVPAAEGRKIQEPHRKARGLAVPFGDVAIQPRLRRKQRGRDLLRRRIDLALQVLVVGKLANQREDQRIIGRLRGTDGDSHVAFPEGLALPRADFFLVAFLIGPRAKTSLSGKRLSG
jgi:hypothetical protein